MRYFVYTGGARLTGSDWTPAEVLTLLQQRMARGDVRPVTVMPLF